MNSKPLIRNALMAVAQVIVSGGVLFLLYRLLLRTIGTELLGVWTIVLATASVSKISEMGFTGSAVKYTAKYMAHGEREKAAEVIQTTVLAISIVLACMLALGYPLIEWLLEKVIPANNWADALAILPYAMASTWVATVAGVYSSGLDGCQRIDMRVQLSMAASLFILGGAWLFVPEYGLVGLAWVQIGQGILMLFGGWILLRRELPSLSLLWPKWNYSLFREMFRYGFNFQVITIFALLVDPITKALMTKFGGLTSTAYFEMANRMVTQFRALLVSANQVMVPQIAKLHENAPEEIRTVYHDSYRAVFFLSLPLYASVIAVAPLVSELWIGHYEQSFIFYVFLIAQAYWINTLVGPAYFVNLGTGLLRWNTWAIVVMALLNIVLGYLLGVAIGGMGVAWGYALAITLGSSQIVLGYHRDYGISLAALFPRESRLLFFACCIGLLACWQAFKLSATFASPLLQALLSLTTSIAVIVPACWVHPLRKKISSRLKVVFV
jgi:O-antigen/teichoic acid export membrane protein